MPDSSSAELEAAFHEACIAKFESCRQVLYWPQIWADMTRHLGGAEAVRRLLMIKQSFSGVDELVAFGRPELTAEWLALEEKWSPLFSEEQLKVAKARLLREGTELPTP